MQLVFASNNINKLEQVKLLLDNDEVLMPKDIGIDDFDVIEDGITLEENAYKKAHEIYKLTKRKVFSDDTGLFVEALDGRPGIYAHRYAGEDATDKDNRNKMLEELKDSHNRKAYFKTVICFIDDYGNDYYFEGILNGEISTEELGNGGFGYDKIFYIGKYGKSLGQMDIDFKNEISHRGLAMKEFKKFLDKKYEDFSN